MSLLIGSSEEGESINPLMFTRAGGSSVLPPLQADVVFYITTFLLQAQMLFWVQMAVLVGGVAWCVALASTIFFGGWYARTHPTTGNDHVIRRLVHLLRFLTFGLTDAPSSDQKSQDARLEDRKGSLRNAS